MITRLELNGFKTFHDFKLEFAPFQVIVGLNGVGKSNLFDALRLIARLADTDLRTAFQDLRGEAGELFTLRADGQPSDHIRLAVELFVASDVQDSWGAQATLTDTRLRYEIEIARRMDEHGLERLYITHESLVPIKRSEDAWLKRHVGNSPNAWMKALKSGRGTPFISTETTSKAATISLHMDGHGGRKASAAEKVERTVLNGVTSTEFPHAFAAREEIRSLVFLQLNPEVLRQPSSMLARPFLAVDGSNLPTALARMASEDEAMLNDVSRDLSNLVPGVLDVEVERDLARNRYLIRMKAQDGRSFSSRVLSDGTLRMLALVTLKNDPQHRGVLCFEEPENGVHPLRLKNMIGLLRDLSTDFAVEEQADEPLRQLLVNTHSPVLVSQLIKQSRNHHALIPELLFAYMTTRVQPGATENPMRMTRIVPVSADQQLKTDLGVNKEEESYTLGQVLEYLDSAEAGEARASIAKGEAQ